MPFSFILCHWYLSELSQDETWSPVPPARTSEAFSEFPKEWNWFSWKHCNFWRNDISTKIEYIRPFTLDIYILHYTTYKNYYTTFVKK